MASTEKASLDLASLKRQAQDLGRPEPVEETLSSREESFEIIYRAPDGSEKVTVLTSLIMNGEDRLAVGRMCGRLSGVSWDTLPPAVQLRIYALSVCMMQLKQPPEWVLKAMEEDDALLDAIYTFLSEHENKFFRRSSAKSGASEELESVVVRKVSSPRTSPLSV